MPAAAVKANPADPIHLHMRTDFARLAADATVGDSLAAIRENPPATRIIYFYAVDEQGMLKGVVPTRRLLLSALETPIAEIMVRDLVALPDSATVLEACEFFIMHRLLAFPVVDGEGRVVGVVDVELYTDELQEIERAEQGDELFQLIGVHLAEARQSSATLAFRSRFPWLLCNVGAGILAAFLTGLFEAELERAMALALFIPVVLALSESVSIQSVSLALQGLRGKSPSLGTIGQKLRAEALTGVFLGGASAALVAAVALVWLEQRAVAICLLGGIGAGVACAAVIGTAIPNVLRLLKWQPQVAAGPVALAMTDMVTLVAYFGLARWVVG